MKAIGRITECKSPIDNYPLLKKSKNNDVVVLFIGREEGTVVSTGGSHYDLGEVKTDWIYETFEIFNGGVCIQNEVDK